MKQTPPLINDEILRFYSAYCDMEDKKILSEHLTKIQQELAVVRNYRCIQDYKFAFSRMYYRFFYRRLIDLAQTGVKEGKAPYLMDIGCCTGTDLRQLYLDGYPVDYLIGLDRQEEYIECGYRLFRDKTRCPIRFQVADVFKDSLREYWKKLWVLHAGSVFHLFGSKDEHREFLRRIQRLLQPHGYLAGGHVVAEETVSFYRPTDQVQKYYIGYREFKDLLQDEGFSEIEIQRTKKVEQDPQGPQLYWISFFCKRV
ncbi:S-adenosyl-L-methionine-dependent methyltransferase [Sporodiniella umbellata]|nr:S-adenosyl-L-methionine-dependent methyltransferase [Sporodiniella umbellata]